MTDIGKRDDGLGLAGKVAIVTGGGAADHGIGNGRAAAILLARAGAKVLVVDLDHERAEHTIAMIREEGGTAAPFVRTSLTRDKPAPWSTPRSGSSVGSTASTTMSASAGAAASLTWT